MSTIDEFLARPTGPPATGGQPPTPEQEAILDAFATGDSLKVEAGAGTGKTTTLTMVAAATGRPGRYLAFNKAIADEAGGKMPRNVTASTAHSLAYRAVVTPELRTRMNMPRLRSSEIAGILDLESLALRTGWGRKHLEPWRLAGIAMRALAVFCQSADDRPGPQHVPFQDGIDPPGEQANNRHLAQHLAPAVRRAWADLQHPAGALPYKHEHYLKAYQLTRPHIGGDFILFDEAQDANPVMTAIVEDQAHAQLVVVGDTAQQIYAWNGAVNALARFDIDRRLWLTQSWRFGPAVAEVANRILDAAHLELRITGHPHHHSTVEHLDEDHVKAVLCRTNAQAVLEVLDALDRQRRPALVGGGQEILRFAYGAADLQKGRKSTHPELACFDTWAEVLDYVEADAQGHELTLLVKLVQRFTVPTLIAVLQHELHDERTADVVISTAHKAKGREWPTVRLAPDLEVERDEETGKLPVDELRLLYVAATRARDVLDLGGIPLTWPDRDGDE